MTLPQSVIESLKAALSNSNLQIFAHQDWGSQNPQHRDLIKTKKSELNLENRFHSVSHCEGLGVICISDFPIGVDVELTARPTLKTVARMSSEAELSGAPSPASLWCAKEAAFKALKTFDQPSVISAITIGDWQNIDSQSETYRLRNSSDFKSPSENSGICVRHEHFTISFFQFQP